MYGLYCIAFIEYILTGKTSLDNTNLFHPNDYKKNDKIIHKHFYGRQLWQKKQLSNLDEKKLMKQETIF